MGQNEAGALLAVQQATVDFFFSQIAVEGSWEMFEYWG